MGTFLAGDGAPHPRQGLETLQTRPLAVGPPDPEAGLTARVARLPGRAVGEDLAVRLDHSQEMV